MMPAQTTLGNLPVGSAEETEVLPLRLRTPLWKRLLPIMTASGILAYLFWHIDIQQCLVALVQADLSIYVPWVIAFIVMGFLLDTQNLAAMLRHFNYPIPFRDALSIRGVTYLLSTIDYSLGLGALIYYLKHDQGIPVMRSTGLVGFFNAITQKTLVYLAIIGLLLLSPANSLLQNFLWVCLAVAIVDIIFIMLLKGLPSRGVIRKIKELNLIKVFHEAPWKSYGLLIFWRSLYYSIFIIFFYFAVRAFHMTIPLIALIAYVPIILLIISMPITPCGFGTAQAAMIYLFKDYGTSVNIMAFGLTYSTSIILFRSLIGLFFANSIAGLVADKTAK